MVGTAAADFIDGLAGRDTMIGGDGNDTYVVDLQSDRVIEAVDGGTDTVQTALAGVYLVANVEVLQYTGVGAFKGTGSADGNLIIGGAGNDTLSGGAGNDTLKGGAGNDRYLGGIGADVFVIGSGVDIINDFSSADDTLQLTWASFPGAVLGAGNTLMAFDLFLGKVSAAAGTQHFIYDTAGRLFYDADGAGSGAAAVQIAQLANKAALTADDFHFV